MKNIALPGANATLLTFISQRTIKHIILNKLTNINNLVYRCSNYFQALFYKAVLALIDSAERGLSP